MARGWASAQVYMTFRTEPGGPLRLGGRGFSRTGAEHPLLQVLGARHGLLGQRFGTINPAPRGTRGRYLQNSRGQARPVSPRCKPAPTPPTPAANGYRGDQASVASALGASSAGQMYWGCDRQRRVLGGRINWGRAVGRPLWQVTLTRGLRAEKETHTEHREMGPPAETCGLQHPRVLSGPDQRSPVQPARPHAGLGGGGREAEWARVHQKAPQVQGHCR